MKKKDSIIFPEEQNTLQSYIDFWNEVKSHPSRFEFIMGKPVRKKKY